MKRSLELLSTRLFLGFAVLILFPFVSLAAEKLTVLAVKRITHPAYRINNLWFGERNPWNRDYTRLLLYEDMGFTDPTTKRRGRGHVWGMISNLKNWSTPEGYEAAARQVSNSSCWPPTSLDWSPLAGEENILYGVYTCDTTISKLNVDTGVRTPVVSYNPGDGTNVSNPRSFGFSSDNRLIVNFNGENWASGGYEVSVPDGTRTRYTGFAMDCSTVRKRWPQMLSHGHMHRSPDAQYLAIYGYGAGQVGVYDLQAGINCSNLPEVLSYVDSAYPNDQPPGHVSWTASNDWFLAENMGSWKNWQTSPYLSNDSIFQVTFDRTTHAFTYNNLLTTTTAGYWKSGEEVQNYHAIPIPVLRKDGKQMIFWSTDGKYSYVDYQAKGVTPWGTEGVFLADLGVLGADVASPRNLQVKSVQ